MNQLLAVNQPAFVQGKVQKRCIFDEPCQVALHQTKWSVLSRPRNDWFAQARSFGGHLRLKFLYAA
jgi:hypothetical protein